MGHLKGSNRKIAQVIRCAVLSPGSAPPGSGSIMKLAVFGVRFVGVNFMIDGRGRVRVVRSVPVWAGVSGSGVVGGTLGVESRAGGWRCNRVNDRASAARPASGAASAGPGIILAGWSLNTVPTT
ncbi:hypothetical protein ACIBSS_08115 [Micromonospora aurantiaca]|uniref:hypothetical protein n=2 Tax=Micromonospora aurantiaca (nom. illeg.) TaxID=47850 RepID=UPI00378C0946